MKVLFVFIMGCALAGCALSVENPHQSNLLTWYDVNVGFTGNSWTNRAGNTNFNLVQHGGLGTPSLISSAAPNGADGALFTGPLGLRTSSSVNLFSTPSSPLTMYFVVRSDKLNAQNFVLNWGTGHCTSTVEIGPRAGTPNPANSWGIHRGCSKSRTTTGGMSLSTTQIIQMTLPASGSASFRIDRAAVGGQDNTGGWLNGGSYDTSSSRMNVGYRDDVQSGNFGGYFEGVIFEIIVYSAEHDSTTIGEIEDYLYAKYFLAITAPPTATATVSPTPSAIPTSTPYMYWKLGESNMGYRRVVEDDGPVAYWPLNDLITHDMAVADIVGNFSGHMTGVLQGDLLVGQSDGDAIEGTSLTWPNNNGASVRLPGITFENLGDNEGTVEFWFRIAGSLPAQMNVLDMEVDGCGVAMSFSVSAAGQATATLVGETVQSAEGVIVADTFHHVVIMLSNDLIVHLYIDGVPIDAQQSSGPEGNMELCQWIVFGPEDNSGLTVDEVAMYPRTLTYDEILNHASTGSLRACRERPCFSGVQCSWVGAETYTCGSCPDGYEGDGHSCELSTSESSRLRYACHPTPGDLSDPTYCRQNCRRRAHCFMCSMNYAGPLMWAARAQCKAGVDNGDLDVITSPAP